MDSKVQKAVYSVVDQLLTKIEDRCDVEKAKLWDLWRTMFNFPEPAKPRVKKTSPKKPLISPNASPVSRAPAPVAPPKIEKPATPPAPVAPPKIEKPATPPAPVAPPKIEKPATPPAPVASPVDQSEQKVDSPVAPVEEAAVAPVEEVRVAEPPIVEEKVEAVVKKLEIEDDDEDDIPIVKTAKKEVNSPKQEENPNKKPECCYIMQKGPRKGQMCGEAVQKKYLSVGMCTFHAKKA
jgi:hypothetical protein